MDKIGKRDRAGGDHHSTDGKRRMAAILGSDSDFAERVIELYRAAGLQITPPAVIGYISSVLLDILILDGYYEYLILWLILTLMVMMACYVIAYPK